MLKSRLFRVLPLFALTVAAAPWFSQVVLADTSSDTLAAGMQAKLELIEGGQVAPASTLRFLPQEIDAWAAMQLPAAITEQKIIFGENIVTLRANIDFLALAEADGTPVNNMFASLLAGKRPAEAVLRVDTANGFAVGTLERVTLSGLPLSGPVLDFLIDTFLLPTFPDVRFGEPVPMEYNIDRVVVRPSGVTVSVKDFQ